MIDWLGAGAAIGGSLLAKNLLAEFLRGKQTEKDLLKSIFVCGQVGTGKTTFLINLMHYLKTFGSVFFITFKDEKTNREILSTFKRHEIADVLYVDNAYNARKIGIPTYGDSYIPRKIDLYADNLLSIYKAIWEGAIFANSEDLFRNIFKGVGTLPIRTPIEVFNVMNLDPYGKKDGICYQTRKEIQDRVRNINPAVYRFFTNTLPGRLTDPQRMSPVQNKQDALVDTILVQQTLCQESPKLKLLDRMKKGKVTVFNYSQEIMGENQARFLSAFTLGMLKLESFQRPDKSDPVFIICDEFPQYTTSDFNNIIDMGRGLGVGFVLACQYLSQVPPHIQASIDGSIGNKYYFRTGKNDSRYLSEHLEVPQQDIKNLSDYYFYKEILANGKRQKIEKLKAPRPMREQDEAIAAIIKKRSLKKYGVHEDFIKKSVSRRLGITDQIASEGVI